MSSRLAPVPRSPNCVSSRAPAEDRVHHIRPLTGTTLDAVKAAMLATPRTRLVEEAPGYLAFVCATRLMGFKDDVQFEVDGDVIHVRSASRVGYGDLGVNRRRVETLREALR